MKTVNIIFPNQLFNQGPLLENDHEIYLIEEYLFFKQYHFHKQKIAFHRASMKAYEHYLLDLNKTVHYIDANDSLGDIRDFEQEIKKRNIDSICLYNPTDDWLQQRIEKTFSGRLHHFLSNASFYKYRGRVKSFFQK